MGGRVGAINRWLRRHFWFTLNCQLLCAWLIILKFANPLSVFCLLFFNCQPSYREGEESLSMESKRQMGPTSSPSTDIFGNKESLHSTASTGTFASIFPPPQSVAGRNLSHEKSQAKHSPGNQVWNSRQAHFSEGASANMPSRDSPIFREERGEPCHLSSSLYYGGQDVYSQYPRPQNPGSYPLFKKDGEKDDPNGANPHDASRGNWWQGSLYY